MTSSPIGSPQTTPGAAATGVGLLIVAILIAGVIGVSFLPHPYYAIVNVVMYAVMILLLVAKLRTCFALAKGSEYYPKLQSILFWLLMAVIPVASSSGNLFLTQDRDHISLVTGVAVYLALLFALQLVEALLRKATVTPA
jgi:hypothetical protein